MKDELDDIDESRQRAIFLRLVELQDQGLDVQQSRERIAEDEELTIDQVREIERAGLTHVWPPLD
jgi:hypothetical protein